MKLIPDDPIVDSILRTGFPPWMRRNIADNYDDDWDVFEYDEGDVYYGNETDDF